MFNFWGQFFYSLSWKLGKKGRPELNSHTVLPKHKVRLWINLLFSHDHNKTSVNLDFGRLSGVGWSPRARLRSSIRKQGLWQVSLDPRSDSVRILLNLKRVTGDLVLQGGSTNTFTKAISCDRTLCPSPFSNFGMYCPVSKLTKGWKVRRKSSFYTFFEHGISTEQREILLLTLGTPSRMTSYLIRYKRICSCE